MHTMDTMGYGHKKYRPPLSPTSFYQHDYYSRHSTLRPQSEYRFAGGGYPLARETTTRSSGLCSAALVGGALLAAVAVLAVAALAFYMGALRPDNGEPIILFEGTLRVTRGDVYGGAPGSPAWRERARRYGASLRQVFSAPSPLRQAFTGALVTGFGDRRLDVHFRLYLDRRKIPSTLSNIEETLKSILIQDINSRQSSFGQIKIDTSSIIIKRDLEHTYHSESYVKEALNESMVTNNQKQIPTQTGKDKTLQSRVGVVRKTTVKPNQSTKKHDPDEPEIDTENIPVVQGTFQITKTEADITENKQNSSPTRHDDKVSKTLTGTKSTTTTKAPTTRTVAKSTTTKRVSTSIPKSRPFTIMSTNNLKTTTETGLKKITETHKSTIKPSTKTISSTTLKSTTVLQTTTTNVSDILLDLLTNENHYKDLPKIDTLFTVPHVIDNEPWRPITQPYYDLVNNPKPTPDTAVEMNAEDRMGVAEVIDDVSILESMLTPIPEVHYKEMSTRRPISLHNVDSKLTADVYTPSPVYTSFTLPTFAPPIKGLETLGSSFPQPHPIPVDKISSVVEFTENEKLDEQDDGKPKERPPKEKTTSVSLNVMHWNEQDLNNTEKIKVDEGSIIKIHNITTTTSSPVSTTIVNKSSTNTLPPMYLTTSTSAPLVQHNISEDKDIHLTEVIASSTLKINSYQEDDLVKQTTTKRPNNKVSIIPSTSAPFHTWELVNTSMHDNNTFSKTSPEKYYNETLQAIITRNDAVFPNTTPKFTGKVSILKNATDIVRRFSDSPLKHDFVQLESEEEQGPDKMTGSVKVVPDEEIDITTDGVITLLPAKSNLGMNRPLRPRPIIKPETQGTREYLRNTFLSNLEEDKFVSDLSTENYFQKLNIQIDNDKTSLVNAPFNKETDDLTTTGPMAESVRVMEIVDNAPSRNRFPKSSELVHFQGNDNPEIPEGTYRVSYHVTGSVSSKQANKTHTLPTYKLTLEPDVVLELPINQTNTLTVDKLKQLASIATISDSNSSSLFSPLGGVISTKAIPSSYTLNQAGFKVLKKTFNKIQSTNQEQNSLGSSEKTHSNKPNKPPLLNDADNTNEAVVKEHCDNATSYQCNNGDCLPMTSRCNKLVDCTDGEDESTCSCADYLRAEFSHSKICDGIVDCWDYTDENNCDWCKEGQYVCSNARQCVDMGRICDGTPDCPLGDDEKSCVTLADDLENNEVIPYNEEGYVMVRKRGVWGRLCVENFEDVVEQAHSTLKLPDLGRAVCRAMTFNDAGWARESREGRKTNSFGYWEVWHNAGARAADTRLTFRRASCKRRRALRVKCTDLDCGIRPHADAQQPRVVGGEAAAAGAWPWQAALYRDGDFQCGATLIHSQWLLSASHCFYQAMDAHWVARLGALRRGAWPRGPWERVTPVRQVVAHPRYAARGFRNDIALLRVDPVPLHARTRPACLPPARTLPPAGTHCTVLGWGQLYEHERVFPDTLQEVELPVISSAECRRRTRLLPLYRVTDDMFCAGYERGGRDACLGDSGGPLMCQNSERWYIYGVTSNGYGCARANRPGVYTKVSNYIDWIETVIANYTPSRNDTNNEYEDEDFYADLDAAENRRTIKTDTCKGYRCPLGKCLPASSVCNGFLECSDGSDEKDCIKSIPNNSNIDPD